MQSTTRDTDLPSRDTADGTGSLSQHFRPVVVWLLAAVALILVGWALRALAVVVVPFVVALFIALAVAPIDGAVQRHVPRGLKWLGHAVALAVVIAILAAFLGGVYLAAQQAVRQMPGVTDEIRLLLPQTDTAAAPQTDTAATPPVDAAAASGGSARLAGDAAGQGTDASVGDVFAGIDLSRIIDRFVTYLSDHAGAFARSILNVGVDFVAGLVLIVFLVLLMLVEGNTWRAKAEAVLSRRTKEGWEDTFSVMAKSFRWYVLVRIGLGAVTGALYVAWLMVFGVDLLVVWFVLAFLLNFIPTIGSILAGALPILYVLVTRDWTTALGVAAGLAVIEQVMGNYVDPLIQGKQLSVSPVVTFFALLLFGWMWGIIGALLAVPIAVFIVIACAHVPALKPIGLLLSDAKDLDALEEKTLG